MLRSRPHQAKAVRPRSGGRAPATRTSPRGPEDFPVVGIGASAGGLDACRKLVDALPANSGMAFILVQHLDPTHESMMVELLAGHTAMAVRQATDGMALERDHIYVIPPGAYLAVDAGVLRLSRPQAPHGARLPFDFLLRSLAEARGARAICVILSGTGTDGNLGLRAVRDKGGLIVAQDPDEAGYDGMPRSAIATGAVDLVLPVAKIPDALVKYARGVALGRARDGSPAQVEGPDWLPKIVDLLRTKTAHDFALYKKGTLRRRIERRMAMAAIETDNADGYLKILRSDAGELDLLAKDLLINVTGFFRDRQVFDRLAETIVPRLVREQASDRPLRIWIAGCSTGEETYSLAMLFHEAIAAGSPSVKLQVFASDVDADAVAGAREGLYPQTIEADVSPARLARFFLKEEQGYRVSPQLRASVVFTVQDVLADPPFSRLDLISCRNLLIYLVAEAQAKVVSLFHFALREGGLLLLGNSENIGNPNGYFELVSKAERLYRRVGRGRPGEFGFPTSADDGLRVPARPRHGPAVSRQAALADLCRRLVTETYAPAAVLINRQYECLYFLGPTDRYLKVAPGAPVHDLIAMAREGVRTKLRAAIQLALKDNARAVVSGAKATHDGAALAFSIAVEPVASEGDELLLVCFVDEPKRARERGRSIAPPDLLRVAELEQELEATRTELQGAIRSLEISSEEQKAVNEEALSINEEFQSTNEELLTSKEELQSLNEELTALNGQLQETLERQRTTANDLQNVLYSTDVATLFLDADLNIRFFTPATKLLFNVIPGDVGRPLADLNALAVDNALLSDARKVLETAAPVEREIEARSGAWYNRRIMPYRTQENEVEGVVITFADVSDRRRTAETLAAAKKQAELASAAKSRFLAAASHDLRQPLQTLTLLHGLLAKTVEDETAQKLITRLDEAVGSMSSMLNTLLDINQIEAGTVRANIVDFAIDDLLDRLRDEYVYHAGAQGLALRVVRCGLSIRSDSRLLEQMIRNLLSNALKYTVSGKVLVGCRRRGERLSIEIWDTGVGIPSGELKAIFEEYHQLDNAGRERRRGLGLGLSIVERLGNLLGHPIRVRSEPGKGSVFSIEVMLRSGEATPRPESRRGPAKDRLVRHYSHSSAILIVEDDPEVCELLGLLLKDEGYRVAAAPDGGGALDLAARGTIRPDLILSDYNLPNGMNGLEVASRLREKLRRHIPVIILTGDISTDALRNIAVRDCVQLNKPVKPKELTQTIQRLLAMPAAPAIHPPQIGEAVESAGPPVIFVVDDDAQVREAIRAVLEEDGRMVETYPTCEAFLAAHRPGRGACLLIDAYLPGMSGLDLLRRLHEAGDRLPAIMITGNSDVPMAVQAMREGASDFIEKPIGQGELVASIERALEQSRDSNKLFAWRETAANQIASLTPRQRQIMDQVLAGRPSKNIAADLNISQRTVENHRASIMKRTGSRSLPALARLALAASENRADEPRSQPPPR